MDVLPDGKLNIDFPNQTGWTGISDEMELASPFKVGDKVKLNKEEPLYGKGSVSLSSVGTIQTLTKEYDYTWYTATVTFPEQKLIVATKDLEKA